MDMAMPAEIGPAWASYCALDREPRGRDLYDKIFTDHWTMALQRKAELAAMMRMARAIEPRVVVEIGTDRGGGFYHWIKCLPTVKLAIGVEIRGTPWEASFRRAFRDVMIQAHACSSVKAFDRIADVDGGIDCLFIDGDKLRFREDFDLYRSLMRPGGLVFMHDIHGDAPCANAFRELADEYETAAIIDLSESADERRRMKAGEPPATPYHAWLRHWLDTSCGVGVIHV